jgi:hypothetical protein
MLLRCIIQADIGARMFLKTKKTFNISFVSIVFFYVSLLHGKTRNRIAKQGMAVVS